MGDLVNSLFGGSKQQQTTMPVDMTPAALKGLRQPFAQALTQIFSGSAADMFSIPQHQGPKVAPITEGEQQILAQLGPDEGASRRALLEQTLGGHFLPGEAGGNPFLEAAIRAAQRPTIEGLTETLERSLPGRFTAGGQFIQPQGSSAFDRAAAIATRGAAQTMGDIATNLSFGVHEGERTRQQQAIQLSQGEVESLLKKQQAQALPRLIEDLGIERGLQEWQTRIASMVELLKILGAGASPTIGQVTRGTTTTSPNVIGTLASAAFGSGGAFGPGASGGVT